MLENIQGGEKWERLLFIKLSRENLDIFTMLMDREMSAKQRCQEAERKKRRPQRKKEKDNNQNFLFFI